MRLFVLTCGGISIQHIARNTTEAFEHGFNELGHLGMGISCRCIRETPCCTSCSTERLALLSEI